MTGRVIYIDECDNMQSGRLMAFLQLLQGERRLTARYLAAELGVSMRTVYRDVDALSAGGVPIHMERGPNGGIVLADGYRRALAQFTSEELQSLFVSGSGPMSDLGIAAQPTALRKLAGALPDGQREAATAARQRLLLDHNRWGRGKQPTEILAQVRRAIDEQRRIRLTYRDRGGVQTDRCVDPLGLVAKAGVWYLICNEDSKGYRTFRAQRIGAVDPLPERFTRPADFDLEAYWNSSVASIESQPREGYDVVLRMPSDAADRFGLYWAPATIERGAESAIVRITFPSRDAAVADVITFGHAIDIIAPADLIDALVAFAQAVVARYRGSRSEPSAARVASSAAG